MENAKGRREARIRKILENSERRLQKITSVENKSTKTAIEGISNFQCNNEDSDSSILLDSCTENVELPNRSGKYNNKELHTIFYNSQLSENASDVQLNNLKSNENHLESHQHSKRRVCIVVLPFIWSVLMIVCSILQINTNELYINKIFLPLVAFEIQDYYFSSNVINVTSRLLSVVIVLTGRTHSKKGNDFILYVAKIFQDIMIYFFIFVVSQIFLKFVFKLQIKL